MSIINYTLMVCCTFVYVTLASSIGHYESSRNSNKGYGDKSYEVNSYEDKGGYGDDKSKPSKFKGGRYYYGGKYSGMYM